MEDSYKAADDTITRLKAVGLDYSLYREQIAQVYDEGIFEGNADCETEINVEGVRELRFIQEDEYDQHMDEDEEKPDWEDMLCDGYAYVWFAD